MGSSSTTTSSRACRFIALYDPYAYTPDDLRERLRGEGYGEDPENVSTIRNIQIKFETHEGGGQTLTVREDIPSDYTDHLNAILAAGPSKQGAGQAIAAAPSNADDANAGTGVSHQRSDFTRTPAVGTPSAEAEVSVVGQIF